MTALRQKVSDSAILEMNLPRYRMENAKKQQAIRRWT